MSTLIFLSLYYCIDFLIRVPLDQVWIIRVSVKADVIDDNSEFWVMCDISSEIKAIEHEKHVVHGLYCSVSEPL